MVKLHVFNSNQADFATVKAQGVYGPTNGYLGVQGKVDYDGTTWNLNGEEIGVLGISEGSSTTDNTGVMGLSNDIGVYGRSTARTGVFGYTDAVGAEAYGIRANNNNASGTGLGASGNGSVLIYLTAGSGGAFSGTSCGIFSRATATIGDGILGVSNGAPFSTVNAGSGITGSSNRFGVVGFATGITGTNSAGGYFSSNSTQSYAYVGGITSSGVLRKIEGNGTVNTTVKDMHGNLVVMSCPEAPENLFQDYGSGTLNNGNAHINLDPIFSKNIVVNSKHPLRVFIQLEGDCNGVYVTNKTASGFDVKELSGGSSSIPFTWTVVANRADVVLDDGSVSRYSEERFAPAQGPQESKIVRGENATVVNDRIIDEKE